ncbi:MULTISPECIES: hypothetical protein [Vibrio harveyi group]|uniref:Uncharacterized protein n=2 Tax=Vibrio harveyi group TaxID=717610 RepID=A0AAU9QR49_9VIBR|nr:hypothetical protein [Vibrio owensii]KIF53170.1 hypothetical protein H735_09535 [Vibrio owensii CAIM 1854 = LMG 25443]PAW02303.1 hypothetical protein CKJ79_16715 [Vibrio coralliilyticus]CAH1589682.1 conserved hypothetical protein [Vibrio jasicida]CAH1599480.1 conserved hypothetical protein [Vibrio jasicida]
MKIQSEPWFVSFLYFISVKNVHCFKLLDDEDKFCPHCMSKLHEKNETIACPDWQSCGYVFNDDNGLLFNLDNPLNLKEMLVVAKSRQEKRQSQLSRDLRETNSTLAMIEAELCRIETDEIAQEAGLERKVG